MLRSVVVTRNRIAGVTSVLGVAVTIGLALGGLPVAATLTSMAALVAVSSWFAWYRPHKRVAMIEVTPDGVREEDKVLATRRFLRAGDAARRDDSGWQIDLHRWIGPRTRVLVESAEVAREVLATLGFDRRSGTTIFRVRRTWAPSADVAFVGTVVVTMLSCAALAWANSLLVFLVPALLLLGALAAGWPMKAIVGSDGITVGRRFVPFRDVRLVSGGGSSGQRRLELLLENGDELAYDTTPELLRGGNTTDHVFAIVSDAWQKARNGRDATSVLLRGARNVREWITQLRAPTTGYRTAAIDDEELLTVVTDATADREIRAAAAVVLAGKPEHAPRLRVAADDVADPVVRRIALTALDDEAHLEAELDAAFRAK